MPESALAHFSQSDFYNIEMFKNILVPTDGSDLSMKPVEPAIRCALQNQGRIVALSVSEPRLFYGDSPDAVEDGYRREEETRKEAHAHLDQVVKAARDANVPCEAVEVQSRTPGDEIVSIANQYHCDAIFMATRGSFNVIEKLFDESQTHKVIEQSSLPVVVFT
jgi:nucleotide-binding universal stress UspA family protein